MKICFYSPYLSTTFGGGEKYLFDVARTYAQKHDVYMAVSLLYQDKKNSDQQLLEIKAGYAKFLGDNLDNLHFVWTPIGSKTHALQKIWWTKQWDVIYYQTDGSTFFSLAKKSILHIQVPLPMYKRSFFERIKLATFRVKNTNSYFTKKVIEKYWNVKINLVHQPGIKLDEFTFNPAKKEKIILHVGRFFEGLHVKNQDVLVEIFQKMRDKHPQEFKDWQFVLIGNVESQTYADLVSNLAKGDKQIKILHGVSRQELLNYYSRATIYWHATGYFDDPTLHPERMEHFGISTLEAMASGCVPIVIGKGGQPEVLGKNLKDLLWLSGRECESRTRKVAGSANKQKEYQALATARAKKFDESVFEKKCWQMLEMK